MIMFIGHKCYTQNPICLLIVGSNIHRVTFAKIILDVKQAAAEQLIQQSFPSLVNMRTHTLSEDSYLNPTCAVKISVCATILGVILGVTFNFMLALFCFS